MSKTVRVAMLMLAAMALMVTTSPSQAADDAKAPAAAPAPAKTPAADGFESAGTPAGEKAAEKAPANGKTAEEGQSDEGTVGTEPEPSPLMRYFPFIMIGGFLILWMFMGRSRKKKEAQRREMLNQLSKGDRVVTIGGIVGTIVEARDTELVVKVDDNTRMKFARWAVRNAGEAVNEDKKSDSQEQQ